MSDDLNHRIGGVREPDPTLGRGEHEPARVERVPAVPSVPAPPEPTAKPPKRQRVVLADPRSRSMPTLRARVELEEQTSWGALLVDDLIKHQLRAALSLAALVVVVLGGLPLAFFLSPTFAGLRVVGVPLGWFLLAVLPFPLFLVTGLVYNRLAERHERDFVDMIEN